MVLTVDRSQSVDDVRIGQVVAPRDYGFPGADRAQRTRLLSEAGTGGGMDRAGHPSPTFQPGVRRVHDRLHVLLVRYIALDYLDLNFVRELALHVSTAVLRDPVSHVLALFKC